MNEFVRSLSLFVENAGWPDDLHGRPVDWVSGFLEGRSHARQTLAALDRPYWPPGDEEAVQAIAAKIGFDGPVEGVTARELAEIIFLTRQHRRPA